MKHFLALTLLTVGMLFTACTGCKSEKQQGPQPTEFEQSMTKKDTADVQQTIAQFFGFLKNKKYYDAAQMLYSRPAGAGSEMELLSNKEMDDYVSFWKTSISMLTPSSMSSSTPPIKTKWPATWYS